VFERGSIMLNVGATMFDDDSKILNEGSILLNECATMLKEGTKLNRGCDNV